MFHRAVAPVAAAVSRIASEMESMFQTRCLRHVESLLRVNFCAVWEEASPEAITARSAIRTRLGTAVLQAQSALSRLLKSQGGRQMAAADMVGMDGELEDVTEL